MIPIKNTVYKDAETGFKWQVYKVHEATVELANMESGCKTVISHGNEVAVPKQIKEKSFTQFTNLIKSGLLIPFEHQNQMVAAIQGIIAASLNKKTTNTDKPKRKAA